MRVINTYRWNFKANVCGFTKYINLLKSKQIKDRDSARCRDFFSFSEKFHGRSHLCYWQGFSAHHLARTLNQERCGSEIKCVSTIGLECASTISIWYKQNVRRMCGSAGIGFFLGNSNLLNLQVKIIENRPLFICKIF